MNDLVYQTVMTLAGKDLRGVLTPEEYNRVCNLVVREIFRSYFEDENQDKNRANRGLSHDGYSDLAFNQGQRITHFSYSATVPQNVDGTFTVPDDCYYIEKHGVIIPSNYRVVEELPVSRAGLSVRSNMFSSSELFPTYVIQGNKIKISPTPLDNEIGINYLRTPKIPKWTYVLIGDQVLFDPTNSSYQDIDLHPSEFSNVCVRILSYYGITVRELEVTNVAEQLKLQLKTDNTGQ